MLKILCYLVLTVGILLGLVFQEYQAGTFFLLFGFVCLSNEKNK